MTRLYRLILLLLGLLEARLCSCGRVPQLKLDDLFVIPARLKHDTVDIVLAELLARKFFHAPRLYATKKGAPYRPRRFRRAQWVWRCELIDITAGLHFVVDLLRLGEGEAHGGVEEWGVGIEQRGILNVALDGLVQRCSSYFVDVAAVGLDRLTALQDGFVEAVRQGPSSAACREVK